MPPNVGVRFTWTVHFDSGKFRISGRTAASARIEGLNLSAIPARRLRLKDTTLVAAADAEGSFSFQVRAREGDLFRMRARTARGHASRWVVTRLQGSGGYERRPIVALCRIGLEPRDGNLVRLFRIDVSRPLGEPGLRLHFINPRTGGRWDFSLNAQGSFRTAPWILAARGDRLIVRAQKPGQRSTPSGALTVPPMPDANPSLPAVPLPAADGLDARGRPRFGHRIVRAPLFRRGGPSPDDVRQGELADCHVSSAAAALAATRPDLLTRIIRPERDGTYSVTLQRFHRVRNVYQPATIRVDARFYVRPSGELLYGADGRSNGIPGALWFPVLEKAFAAWKRSYEAIGIGGMPCRVFEAVMGVRPGLEVIDSQQWERLWALVVRLLDERRPIVVITGPVSEWHRYRNMRVYPDHTYSVVGYQTASQSVVLRNPWGETTPDWCVARGPGTFEIGIRQFVRYARILHTVLSEGSGTRSTTSGSG
jgi:hypothetical protein